ncbi:SecY-interacting protein [Thalassotalea sp. PLHSN55]|uniref:SecY-interacting protein n=1 Tax=Thalassotalea sp. PLHSN55 TaxID=3435888 RepID=UPI003F8705C5
MKITNPALSEIIWQTAQKYLQAYREKFSHLPLIEKDEQWLSPCEQETFDDKHITWQPVNDIEALDFDNVEQALEMTLHDDIKTYFTSIYSDALSMSCADGGLDLLFAWNKDDFERLQGNIIGHIIMKKKLKQALTVFIAATDDDEHIISVNNDTGEVWVERVGKEPHKKLAESLAEFLSTLSPDFSKFSD